VASNDGSRVWLITGSSSGFGRHIAQAALARGDRVLAAPLDVTRADQVEAATS
jgi:NAD(P)-dependent dehydrogenase (short-subunit alcohol dehydrogenase family)